MDNGLCFMLGLQSCANSKVGMQEETEKLSKVYTKDATRV